MICLRMRRNVLRVCLTPVIFLSSLLFCCAAVRGSHGAEQRELLTLMMPEVGPEGVRVCVCVLINFILLLSSKNDKYLYSNYIAIILSY